jgi:hypothetical protein
VSYSRPETWDHEPREQAPPPEETAWGPRDEAVPAQRPGGRRARREDAPRGRRKGKPRPSPITLPRFGSRNAPDDELDGADHAAEEAAARRVDDATTLLTAIDPAADHASAAEPAEDPTMPPPSPPWLHRLPPIAITVVITAGLILGAQLERGLYGVGLGALQVAMLACVVWTRRVGAPWLVLAPGAILAAAAGWSAVAWTPVSLLPPTVLLALAFLLTAAVHVLHLGHADVTERLGLTALLCLAVVGYTCYIALSRLGAVPPAMYSAVVAAGTAVVAARAVDLVMPDPRINRQVPRGAFGVVIGTMCGTAAAAYAGLVIEGPEPGPAAIGGLLVALTAVLADLALGYMAASRRIDGDGAAPWPVTGVAGPLLAFAAAGPVVYLLSAYYIID